MLRLKCTVVIVMMILLSPAILYANAGPEWEKLIVKIDDSVENMEFANAEVLAQKALLIAEKKLGNQHLDVAASLDKLAFVYLLQDKFDKTEKCYQRALQIRETNLGVDNEGIITSLYGLADLYSIQKKFNMAELFYKRALMIQKKTFGKDHNDVADTLSALAYLYLDQGDDEQHRIYFNRACEIWEKTLKPLDVVHKYHFLAMARTLGKRYDLAESLYKRTLIFQEKNIGSYGNDIAITYYFLANMYFSQEKFDLAEPIYKQIFKIGEKNPEVQQSFVILSRMELIELYRKTGRQNEASDLEKILSADENMKNDRAKAFIEHFLRNQH